MNERIRQLAEQAGIEWKQQPPHFTNTSNPINFPVSVNRDLEKFAELIVKDIAKTVFNHLYNQDTVAEYNEYGWDCLPGDLRTMIEKHFGVEE
jgi:hypothetical protein